MGRTRESEASLVDLLSSKVGTTLSSGWPYLVMRQGPSNW